MSDPVRHPPEPEAGQSEQAASDAPQPIVVKKYANRRLYNTDSSSYITLDNLAEMVRAGRDFVVYDAKTGEDITRSVLTQIIVEEESKGRAMLPTSFLRHLIGFYGDSLQALVPRYLEQAMSSFALQQQQMRKAMQQTMGNFFPFGGNTPMEELGRQNLAMMERAMSLFAPFYRPPGEGAPFEAQPAKAPPETSAPAASAGPPPRERSSADEELAALRAEVAALRGQLSRVEGKAPAAAQAGAAPQKPGRRTGSVT